MHRCDVRCPELKVPCDSRPHGPGVAHHAGGAAGDGTRWSLFWWEPGEVPEPPAQEAAGSPAEGPGRPPG
jgi:hypothetical protein